MTEQTFALWLTGLPASGKTTLANLLHQKLMEREVGSQVLDSDEVRKILTPSPSYTEEERAWFYNCMAYLGGLLVMNEVNVLIAATAHREVYRKQARVHLPDLLEIFVHCPVEICIERDQKGIYEKAMQKEADSVPGINELYEAPEAPFIRVDSEGKSPLENSAIILGQLVETGLIPG